VKSVRIGLVCLGALFPLVAGCGSSTPAFSVSCTIRQLSAGRVRAAVTITNNTSTTGRALLFGPVLGNLRQFTPVILTPTRVLVEGSHGQTSYIAFTVPHVRPNHPSHLVLQMVPPTSPESLAVTNLRTLQAGDSDPLNNPDCVIKGH
jgi:hypothetical protein